MVVAVAVAAVAVAVHVVLVIGCSQYPTALVDLIGRRFKRGGNERKYIQNKKSVPLQFVFSLEAKKIPT